MNIHQALDEINFSQPRNVKNIRNELLTKNIKISKRGVTYHLNRNNNFSIAEPLEVGSQKHFVNVWKKLI